MGLEVVFERTMGAKRHKLHLHNW